MRSKTEEKFPRMLAGGRMTRGRQKLGDITNVNQQENRRKFMARQEDPTLALSQNAKTCSYLLVNNSEMLQNSMTQNGKPDHVPTTNTADYSKLLMEYTSLLELLAERNQTIENKNLESQKLRTTLQKLQLQNLQLAQANTQMLAELNMGNDKLKVLQHELTCTLAALKVKNLNQEDTFTRLKAHDVARGSVSLTTKLKVQGEEENDNKRRTKGKKSSKVKSQNCKPPFDADGTWNENEHIQLLSPANTNINTDAPVKLKIQNGNGKLCCLNAEKIKRHKKRKLLAPSDAQVIRRSKRRVSSDNQLHACELKPSINSNDLSNENQQILLVSSANMNLYGDGKTSSIDAETIKQTQKRKVVASSIGQEVPGSKPALSKNIKLDLCEPESLASKLQTCEREPPSCANNYSMTETKHAPSVSSAISDLNIFPIDAKQQDTDASFHQHHGKKAGQPRKRKHSAPSQDHEIPRLSLIERPSRRATIGVTYKEMPLNVKMRRSG